jgi:hypothetical protein
MGQAGATTADQASAADHDSGARFEEAFRTARRRIEVDSRERLHE